MPSQRKKLKIKLGDFQRALIYAVVWQVFFTILGVILASVWGANDTNKFGYWLDSPLKYMVNWDGHAYYNNLFDGYLNPMSQGAVFYPLFSILVYALHFVTFTLIPPVWCGLIVNTLALAVIFYMFKKICEQLKINVRWVVMFFLTFVSAGFLNFFYTEAVFVAGSLVAYYFALSKQWWKMGVALAVLTAARLPAILVVGLCGLEYLRSNKWRLDKNALWFLLAPVGFLAFGMYLYVVRGDFLAMFNMYNVPWTDWPYQQFTPNIFGTLINEGRLLAESVVRGTRSLGSALVAHGLPLYALGILLATSLYGLIKIKRWAVPLGVFGLVSFILFTINGNINSVHRYVLSSISVWLILGYMFQRARRRGKVALGIFAGANTLMMLVIFGGFVLYYFTG